VPRQCTQKAAERRGRGTIKTTYSGGTDTFTGVRLDGVR